MLRCQFGEPIQSEGNLREHRMLDPQRTVLIKRGNAILFRNKLGACWVRSSLNKRYDCRLGWSLIPGREVIDDRHADALNGHDFSTLRAVP
jgi:hypothetical protein